MNKKNSSRPIYKRWWFWVLLVMLIIIIAAAIGGKNQSNKVASNSPSPSSSQTAAPVSATSTSAKADIQLTSGNYTSGIDFPAGKYNITALSGSGNVSSSNMYNGGINATMGTAEANKAIGGNMYQQQYSNIDLPDGVVMSISGGVTIQITSDNVSTEPLKPRIQPNTQTVELGNGNFIAGKDFPAGTYDIVALSGSGNVSTDNMYNGGINALMGTKEANNSIGGSMYEQSYKNVALPDEVRLTIDGVKIQLIPSK